MHHDVCAPLDWTNEIRGWHRVVNNEWHANFVCNLADAFDIKHVVARVRQHFAVKRFGVWLGCCAPLIEIVWVVNERDFNSKLWQRVVEQVVGAAVQAW